jgi:sugar lactone lactonase YvrE
LISLSNELPSSNILSLSFVTGILNIPPNARWSSDMTIVAGGHGSGEALNQLQHPYGIDVDEDRTVLIADYGNHRIVEWKSGATSGQVVAGGNGKGDQNHQLYWPTVVIIDKETNTLLICDRGNRRVVRWPRRKGTRGQTIIENIPCWGLAMDDERSLYVSDHDKHEVIRYRDGEKNGVVVAGGNDRGDRPNQLNQPSYLFVDGNQSVYVSEPLNHRVTKWMKDEQEGLVVAGGWGVGKNLSQLYYPCGLFVDQLGTVYVVDSWNGRVVRWPKGATEGRVIVDGNVGGNDINQLYRADGLSFDPHGNLYIVDYLNHSVQQFLLNKI